MRSVVRDHLGWRLDRLAQRAVDRGLPPGWLGYRWVRKESLLDHVARLDDPRAARVEAIHPESYFRNPLPRNMDSREALPKDRGWWGYSMHDVPHRRSAPTLRGTLERARVLPWMDPDAGYFRPAILTRDRSSLELREVSFRPVHTRLLRSAGPPVRIERATWVMERVYDNHSHWLTAHLPKLRLLRDEGAVDDVLLPPSLTATMASSLRMLGIEAEQLRTFDPSRPLDVELLTVLSTDRFRPELLRATRDAIAPADTVPTRRIYVSRARAKRRRLLNEDRIWGLLKESGFERVFMEDHDFEWQVQLMKSTRVLFAPHGAGLTNMMFCPEGAQIVEIANLGFPNPNFYALSAAMGHDYWLIPAAPVGDVHPLEQDLVVDPADVARVVEQLSASSRPA